MNFDMHICIYTYMHIYIYAYMHIYIYAYIHEKESDREREREREREKDLVDLHDGSLVSAAVTVVGCCCVARASASCVFMSNECVYHISL